MSLEKNGYPLSQKEKETLLTVARTAIAEAVSGAGPANAGFDSPALREKRGAFVSLYCHGQLRGCIGYVIACMPLMETVREMARSAALCDPRFEPVCAAELASLRIEISVLSPMRPIHDLKEIHVGEHGLYVKHGCCAGLLLPQVATKFHWDAETFVRQTCTKAGLPENAWREDDIEVSIFSAEVFGDN